jgi:hypothetical protein
MMLCLEGDVRAGRIRCKLTNTELMQAISAIGDDCSGLGEGEDGDARFRRN